MNAYNLILGISNENEFTEYEVGTGVSTSIKELVQLLKELTGSSSELKFGALPNRENEFAETKAKNKSLLDEGWKPVFDLRSGLNQMLSNFNHGK